MPKKPTVEEARAHREKIATQNKIAERYEKICEEQDQEPDDRMGTMMDLDSADQQFNMDWQKLLDADDFNFSHDVFGIKRHIDRTEYPGIIGNCFLPRCTHREKPTKTP